MNDSLKKFASTLNPDDYNKAIKLKEALEKKGISNEHFSIGVRDDWENGFQMETIKNYPFVKDQLGRIEEEEKNLKMDLHDKV